MEKITSWILSILLGSLIFLGGYVAGDYQILNSAYSTTVICRIKKFEDRYHIHCPPQ